MWLEKFIFLKWKQKNWVNREKSERLIFIICCKATKLMTRAIGLEHPQPRPRQQKNFYDRLRPSLVRLSPRSKVVPFSQRGAIYWNWIIRRKSGRPRFPFPAESWRDAFDAKKEKNTVMPKHTPHSKWCGTELVCWTVRTFLLYYIFLVCCASFHCNLYIRSCSFENILFHHHIVKRCLDCECHTYC